MSYGVIRVLISMRISLLETFLSATGFRNKKIKEFFSGVFFY